VAMLINGFLSVMQYGLFRPMYPDRTVNGLYLEYCGITLYQRHKDTRAPSSLDAEGMNQGRLRAEPRSSLSLSADTGNTEMEPCPPERQTALRGR
jgi:hypothetical protein